MDHWGDPWADNADEKQLPTKIKVTSPLPPTLPSAPSLLNGFLDDAGWGNQDDAFGGWATSGTDVVTSSGPETLVTDSAPIRARKASHNSACWDTEEGNKASIPTGGDDWPGELQDTPDTDNVLSETSESSTAIQLDEDPKQTVNDSSTRLQPDEDSSARPSTSPSETSHNEPPVESPRTSIEEEHGTGKLFATKQNLEEKEDAIEDGKDTEDGITELRGLDSEGPDDEVGNSSENIPSTDGTSSQVDTAQDTASHSAQTPEEQTIASEDSPVVSPPSPAATVANVNAFTLDTALLDELFPPPRNVKELEEAPEDPIYSTSGRKAWYRLTRKQTLRGYNHGPGDDNYIRVKWANSHIRSEVNKTVGRWAREDRMSGTGPGARASFYWDTPAPKDHKLPIKHARTATSFNPTPRAVAPSRQSLPPASTNTPAAFNWSSPAAFDDPWKQDSPALSSTSSPVALEHAIVENVQNHDVGAVSVDLTPRNTEHGTHKRAMTAVDETPAAANLLPPPISSAPTASSDPWAGLSILDTHTSARDYPGAPVDDDEDWGEMISSPTISTPNPTVSSLATTLNNTLSTPSPTPHSVESSPVQNPSVDSMHASPIVRLRSTISPTSALFAAKSFVPLNVESGPIGPGILKPVNSSVASTPEKSKSEPQLSAISERTTERVRDESLKVDGSSDNAESKATTLEPTSNNTEADDFSEFTSSTLQSESVRPSTPPPPVAVPTQPITDSLADADFSIFETPPRPTSFGSSATSFERSPPRNMVPPSVQPLTGATNSAQQRKIEEEQIIKDILDGLPSLSYMLR